MSSSSLEPKFSIVIPAYNASATIQRTIESVISQSFPDWEIVVCDDGSSDNTLQILEKFNASDSRIKYIVSEKNSGHAHTPRMRAIEASKANYIVQLDADDWISNDYLEKLADSIEKTNADVVFARMKVISPQGLEINSIDLPQNYHDKTISGEEALLLTLYKWQVSGLGAIKKDLYFQGIKEIEPSVLNSLIYSDDILIRCILLHAKEVAFSSGTYFYLLNNSSITHVEVRSYYQRAVRDQEMLKIIERHFSYPSQIWTLAYRKNVCQLIDCLQLMIQNKNHSFSKVERRQMDSVLKDIYKNLNNKKLRLSVSPKLFALLRFGYLPAKSMLWFYDCFKR